jgi:hypothetical protein
MTTRYTPNLSYDYDADVEKAYNNQRKKYKKRMTEWSPEMV